MTGKRSPMTGWGGVVGLQEIWHLMKKRRIKIVAKKNVLQSIKKMNKFVIKRKRKPDFTYRGFHAFIAGQLVKATSGHYFQKCFVFFCMKKQAAI